MFYWSLLNLHPAHRSTLQSIQLLAVAKSSDIRVYGMDAILIPVVADLKILAKDVCVHCIFTLNIKSVLLLYNVCKIL